VSPGPPSKRTRNFRKAQTRDSLQALSKLGELVDGKYRIVSQPPIVVPIRELQVQYGMDKADVAKALHDQFREYRSTLQDDRRHLLEKFEVVDMARSAVPAGQGGDPISPGGSPAEKPLPQSRRTGGPGAAHDAGCE